MRPHALVTSLCLWWSLSLWRPLLSHMHCNSIAASRAAIASQPYRDNTQKKWLATELHQDMKYTFFRQGVTSHFSAGYEYKICVIWWHISSRRIDPLVLKNVSVPWYLHLDINAKFVQFGVIFHFAIFNSQWNTVDRLRVCRGVGGRVSLCHSVRTEAYCPIV